jgi:hypothetical protein
LILNRALKENGFVEGDVVVGFMRNGEDSFDIFTFCPMIGVLRKVWG